MKHTHHHFLMTFAIVVTLFVASLYFYMNSSLKSMTQDVIDTRSKVASLQSINNKSQKLKKLDKNSADDWKKLYGMFVTTDGTVSFIESLESLGVKVGSEISITAIDNVAPESGSLAVNGYVSAKVSVRGSWTSVLKTLMLVENMPYKAIISNVQISENTGETSTVSRWGMSFDIKSIKAI